MVYIIFTTCKMSDGIMTHTHHPNLTLDKGRFFEILKHQTVQGCPIVFSEFNL